MMIFFFDVHTFDLLPFLEKKKNIELTIQIKCTLKDDLFIFFLGIYEYLSYEIKEKIK